MKSEPREEERKRMGISIGGGEMEMAVTISVLKLKMEISVWCYLYWNISLPKTHISTIPCLLLHLLLHSFFDSVFLLDSSPCVLLPLLLARCAPPLPICSLRSMFSTGVLRWVMSHACLDTPRWSVLWCWHMHASLRGRGKDEATALSGGERLTEGSETLVGVRIRRSCNRAMGNKR